ncbi:MAG: GtrA family protein [Clostridia bacterium]|nr:GtrA family protein [Clostridia bacterium]
MKEKLLKLLERLEHSKLAPLVQFIKFGLVGVTSTLISYGVEMLCYYVLFRDTDFSGAATVLSRILPVSADQVRVGATTLIAFAISVTHSYLLNSHFTFAEQKQTGRGGKIRAYLKTVASYALTGLLLAPAIKIWLVGIGIPFYVASLMSLVVTIPINFVLNKFWAFRTKKTDGEDGKA